MPTTYEPIATTTAGSVTSVSFASIASTYTDLICVINGKPSGTSYLAIQFNDDNGGNFSNTHLYGNGSSAGSGRYTNLSGGAYLTYDYALSSGAPGTTIVQIMNYSNTTTYKTFLARANSTQYTAEATVGLWRSTSAINKVTIKLEPGGSNMNGMTFTLYGIKAA
tara:strand:+ start:2858 stop:3352 length:495 start_codon:yes stop_codon:yes gene_type:complete